MADDQKPSGAGLNWKLVTVFAAGIVGIWVYLKNIDSSRYEYVVQENRELKSATKAIDSAGKIKDSINTVLKVEVAQLQEQLKEYNKKIDSLKK